MPCDEISADWAAQRIKGLSLGGAVLDGLKRSLGLNRRPNDGMETKTLLETFRYPRKGPGMMWEAARDFVVAKGNRVLMDHALQQLSFDKKLDRWRVAAKTGAGKSVVINAAHVISSAPIRELSQPNPPAAQGGGECAQPALPRLPDRRADDPVERHLSRQLDLHPRFEGEGRPNPELPQLVARDGARSQPRLRRPRIFLLRGRRPVGVPATRTSSSSRRRKWQVLGMCDPADVEGGVVVRQEKAYPVYDDHYRDNVEAIRAELEAAYPTLHLVGRNGMHRYNNQDHAMMTAMLTVRNIQAGRRAYDIWAVNEDAEYHEAGDEGEQAALASERLVPKRLKAA